MLNPTQNPLLACANSPEKSAYVAALQNCLRRAQHINRLLSKSFLLQPDKTYSLPYAPNITLIDNFNTLSDEYYAATAALGAAKKAYIASSPEVQKAEQNLELKTLRQTRDSFFESDNARNNITAILSNKQYSKVFFNYFLALQRAISFVENAIKSNAKELGQDYQNKLAELTKASAKFQNLQTTASIYHRLAYTALSACALLLLTKNTNFVVEQKSVSMTFIYPIIMSALNIAAAKFNFNIPQTLSTCLVVSMMVGIPVKTYNVDTPILKLAYFTALSNFCNIFDNSSTPNILDFSATIFQAIATMSITTNLGFASSRFALPIWVASNLLLDKIAFPYFEAYIEDKSYAKIAKASVATCAVGALVYAIDGGKMLSGLNISSLLSRGAAIAA